MKFVGLMNSTRVHYSRKTWSTIAAGKKKKEEKVENAKRGKRRRANALSKHLFILLKLKTYS